MASHAKVENGIVTTVIVTMDSDEDTFADRMLAETGEQWVRTSYNTLGGIHANGKTPLRKNYAGIGYVYDLIRDAFIPPKCHDEATVNESTCQWDCSNADHNPQI